MKIAVIGGTGVFGERLVRLLVRDGHEVIVIGRGAAAIDRLMAELGVIGLVLDRTADLAPLWALSPIVVVDAAGPFHAYGADPYRLPKAAIAQGVNYLDLADDAAFCAGIAALEVQAKAAGVFALSGVSSVPALSSAVVTALSQDIKEIDTISIAILPGNRAPRGQSVVDSILHQAGTTFGTVVDRRAEPRRSWSHPQYFSLGKGMIRQGWMIEVPDQRLLPKHFNARTVEFRAGLELWLMNYGLAALSWLRHALGLGMPRWVVGAVRLGAGLLARFGSDRGGMVVRVTGKGPDGWVAKDWTLVVRKGHGPYIPGIAARTILRDVSLVPAGAGPALSAFTLTKAEAAMADLAVTLTQTEAPLLPLFRQALGPAFATLPEPVRATHDHAGPRRWVGLAKITRGRGVLARLIAVLFRFPAVGTDIPVTVLKTPVPGGEIWDRRFGAGLFRSHLRLTAKGMTERFGPMTFGLNLFVKQNALHFPVVSGRCLGIPLPRFLLPVSVAREYAYEDRFCFDVALYAPFGAGLIVRYKGWLYPDPARPLQAAEITVSLRQLRG